VGEFAVTFRLNGPSENGGRGMLPPDLGPSPQRSSSDNFTRLTPGINAVPGTHAKRGAARRVTPCIQVICATLSCWYNLTDDGRANEQTAFCIAYWYQ
jgi:hypothetical protein